PDISGVEAARRIHHHLPAARLIAMTMHDEEFYLVSFLEAGGVGHIHKSAADRDLIRTIRSVLAGHVVIQPEGAELLARQVQSPQPTAPPTPGSLSPREFEVLRLTSKGFTSREIGEQLHLSARTIETYRERIMKKLNLKHRSELVEYALLYKIL
ncbi:MAG: response regulator transcription factor, partial [Chloroflexi bacterium]|nr:response regulator transcription factor [Chloroflexota bacterium]